MIWVQENMITILILVMLMWFFWGKLVKPKLAGVKSMTAQDFQTLKAYTLVDVRTLGEWQSGRAAEAVHIPLHEVKQRLSEVPKDKAVVCICASGIRSLTAASTFGQAGYKEVYNFSGGMSSYKAANLPTKS